MGTLHKLVCSITLLIYLITIDPSVGGSFTPKNCGKVPPTIDGPGLQKPEFVIPWTAQITVREETTPDENFPAVLLTPSLVLASAHYFQGSKNRFRFFNISSYSVTVGSLDFGDPLQTLDELSENVNVSHIQIHPKFSPGNWFDRKNDYALFHLESPVTTNSRVEPICLPDSTDTELIEQLKSPTAPDYGDELVLDGWNRGSCKLSFLRLKTQSKETCKSLWDGNNETKSHPYNHKWCAVIGSNNNHTYCIHRDVGGSRNINGTHYFVGIVDNFYSRKRRCPSGAEYYFRDLDATTIKWIEANVRCGSSKFTCGSGECIPQSDVCDQKQNCEDNSDEDHLYCRGRDFCPEGKFECGTYGPCIDNKLVKDGTKDCEGGEDEEGYVPIVQIVAGLIISFVVVATIIILYYKRKLRDLTQSEMDDFLKGSTKPQPYLYLKRKGTLPRPYVNDPIQAQPWKKEFNIAHKDIVLGDILDRGNFGVVYKAILTKDGAQFVYPGIEVAAKKNSESVAVHEFKAILCEIKTLAYIGNHANIVKFHGACVENIKKREVLLVVELCPNGSLRDYLLKNGKYFVNRSSVSFQDSGTDVLSAEYTYDHQQYGCLEEYDLILWSTQTAAGLEYLASVGIVHGDVAARNVLLSVHFDAKICDFGLSHQLPGYSGVYVKSSDDPVPFKWLAIETLESNNMSEKSDVWGFGVTMWEIFNLGETPYNNAPWSKTFLSDLLAGLRLPQPIHATNEIYELMKQSWKKCPMTRPTFSRLRDELTIILHRTGSSKRSSGSSEVRKEVELEYFRPS